jgi:hypothetical protein
MKQTQLEKLKAAKIVSEMNRAGAAKRPDAAAPTLDRREQRRRDKELGLVPFAVKLHGTLVKRLQTLAQERKMNLNEVVSELLEKGLAAAQSRDKKKPAA